MVVFQYKSDLTKSAKSQEILIVNFTLEDVTLYFSILSVQRNYIRINFGNIFPLYPY